MNRAENSDSIPIDLILEIFSRLPSKSVGRFHCVSKLWRSMLSSPYFKELYLTRSSTRPRLLFVVHSVGEEEEEEDKLHFYSSSQPQIPYDKSSLVVAADYHTTFPSERCSYASGLICFRGKGCSGEEAMTLICNPITGQYAELPKVIMYFPSTAFLGFDPIDKQFKILLEHFRYSSATHRHIILTLGVPKLGWRSDICCPKYYLYLSEGICISGVIYYLVRARYSKGVLEIVCFDVRYEEFKVIEAQCFYNHHQTLRLINYKGKLGGITGNLNDSGAIELRMWVLHDVGKQEWSEYVYTLPENDDIKLHDFTVAGMTTRGEFVLSMIDTFKPFYVFYFNPEKNALRSVEIQGFGEDVSSVEVFVDHVEDFNFLRRESS
ncbi:F-box protein At3g57590-like [Brassica rapa]|uniref:F-box protein At3g57590-like n=1 Tax=Brassica campestris TaxID=3711 RepID=UPI00142E3582|nr:F-box protein At3g57590-like [Brassica rapa]